MLFMQNLMHCDTTNTAFKIIHYCFAYCNRTPATLISSVISHIRWSLLATATKIYFKFTIISTLIERNNAQKGSFAN